MAKAIDVARNLIHLAAAEEEPDFLTHLRLQKLLYYAQGWSLAMRDQAVFDEEIQAWAHGPVVRKVYPAFASYGNTPIDPEKIQEADDISLDESVFLISLWESYKGYSASSLREMTHREPPWRNARGSCGPADKCETEITKEAMKEYFSELAASQ
jgi:uncharacterized phage-associated protein